MSRTRYVVFEPGGPDLAVSTSLPVVRDYERKIYIKPEVGGLMVGAFEGPHRSMPAEIAQRNAGALAVPADASHELYDEEYDKVESGLMAAMALIPGLGSCGIKAMTHGPDVHSVDHEPLLGHAPRTHNLWLATGFNSLGIQTGPGVVSARRFPHSRPAVLTEMPLCHACSLLASNIKDGNGAPGPGPGRVDGLRQPLPLPGGTSRRTACTRS